MLYNNYIFDDHLNSNNVGFYFDYQNGTYGYNTSANRGADTFSPFKQDYLCWGTIQYTRSYNIAGHSTTSLDYSLLTIDVSEMEKIDILSYSSNNSYHKNLTVKIDGSTYATYSAFSSSNKKVIDVSNANQVELISSWGAANATTVTLGKVYGFGNVVLFNNYTDINNPPSS